MKPERGYFYIKNDSNCKILLSTTKIFRKKIIPKRQRFVRNLKYYICELLREGDKDGKKKEKCQTNRVTLGCRDFSAKQALIEYGRLCNDGLEHGEDSSSTSDGSARTPGEKVRVRQEGVDRGAKSAARDPTSRASDSPPPCNSLAAFLITIRILRKRDNL